MFVAHLCFSLWIPTCPSASYCWWVVCILFYDLYSSALIVFIEWWIVISLLLLCGGCWWCHWLLLYSHSVCHQLLSVWYLVVNIQQFLIQKISNCVIGFAQCLCNGFYWFSPFSQFSPIDNMKTSWFNNFKKESSPSQVKPSAQTRTGWVQTKAFMFQVVWHIFRKWKLTFCSIIPYSYFDFRTKCLQCTVQPQNLALSVLSEGTACAL